MNVPQLIRPLGQRLYPLAQAGLRRGVPPAWLGYRCMIRESVQAYFARHGHAPEAGTYETVHPEATALHPLPENVAERGDLPGDRGWWGYAFRDVPARRSGETFVATLPGCTVVPHVDPDDGQFWVAILNRDARALELREIAFRARHAQTLRRARGRDHRRRATWILERVYDNHSHWLTAHLPKLLLLKARGALADVVMPRARTPVMDHSMRMLGLDPDAFATFDPARPLEVDELTILGTDRFRPELLRLVRAAFDEAAGAAGRPAAHRRVYISRARAPRRRLVNEDAVWPVLEAAGFERVFMEDLAFPDQVALMQETAVLAAPHGAGLTNMMFCPEGTRVVEIADLSFPNPNFYAVASAMGHRYWIVEAEGLGEGHPLTRDMRVEPAAVERLLPELLA